jgi:hypothetical protein
MTEHALYAVMRATPVNSAARKAVRQGSCLLDERAMSRAELVEVIDRLQRKLRLLKQVLGIKNKAQHSNLIAAIKGKRYGSGKFRARENPRSAAEYFRLGKEIQRMNRALQELKVKDRGEPLVQHGWSAA